MPLIKEGETRPDSWTRLDDDAPAPASGDIIVSLARLLAEGEALAARDGRLGVTLTSADGPEAVAEHLGDLALVALQFPRFADGRAYSTARLLRTRWGFGGEIRAVGEVLLDQLSFMTRCGFDAFEFDHPRAASAYAEAMTEIGPVYQAAADRRAPVWARRTGQRAAVAVAAQ
ncbi:MAG: DUF934 domain-containing protein [Caulobacterales bacterium]|nr:DUF934 domain-containing protein [Caulobacterales bacterium]